MTLMLLAPYAIRMMFVFDVVGSSMLAGFLLWILRSMHWSILNFQIKSNIAQTETVFHI